MAEFDFNNPVGGTPNDILSGQQVSGIPKKKSFRITESDITNEGTKGKEIASTNYFDRLREAANKPINPLLAAVVSLGKNLPQLQQASQYQNPLISMLIGAGGGAQIPGALMQQQQETAMSQIDNAPMDEVAPDFVKANPWAKGIPVGTFQKVAAPLAAMMKREKEDSPITLGTAMQLKNLRPDLTDEQIQSLTESVGSKYVLEFTKEQGRTERAVSPMIEATDPMLDEYAKTLGVPKESIVGKEAKPILNWYGRIKTRQERVMYGEPQPIKNESGDTIGFYQVSSQGKLASNVVPTAAGASQKEKDLNAVTNIMGDLFNTALGFDPESGVSQRFIGFKETLKARAGLAPDKKAYIDSLDSFLGNLSREYSGERGVLTDQDVARIKAALPSLYDTEDEINFKYKQVLKVVSERQKAISGGKTIVPMGNKSTAKPETNIDPLGIR